MMQLFWKKKPTYKRGPTLSQKGKVVYFKTHREIAPKI